LSDLFLFSRWRERHGPNRARNISRLCASEVRDVFGSICYCVFTWYYYQITIGDFDGRTLRLIIPFLHTQWYGYEWLSDQRRSIKRTLESLRLYLLCAQTGVFILWSLGREVRLVGNTRLFHCSDWVIYLGGAICWKWIRYYTGNSGDFWVFCGLVGYHI